jgi:hypothetical protein
MDTTEIDVATADELALDAPDLGSIVHDEVVGRGLSQRNRNVEAHLSKA